jgi:D-xylose transport system substrate-binding protein
VMQRRDFLGSAGIAAAAGALALTTIHRPHRAHAADKVKVGFLLKTMQEDRYQTDKALFVARAESLGAEVLFESGNNDELTQLQQFEALLEAGVRVIVLQPVDTGTAGGLIAKAHARGVPVIGYDSMPQDTTLDLMVMQDSWAVGKLQGEALVEWLKAKKGKVEGKVALIRGQPGDSNAAAMSSGVLEIVKANPGLELVVDQSHEGWAPDKAMATAENVLTKYGNNVDAFICNNSGMARGVIAALDAQGLASSDQVFVAGSDADLVNIQYVAQGKETVEIWKKVKPLAEKAAEVAVQLAQNPDAKPEEVVKVDKTVNNGFVDVPTIVTPIVAVTKDNIKDTIIKEGVYTEQQVYEKS